MNANYVDQLNHTYDDYLDIPDNDTFYDYFFNLEEFHLYPLKTVYVITPIYTTLFLVGMIGNILTCTVIARNKPMHTPTNYYLFSLAVSDMLILITNVPYDMHQLWSNKFPELSGCLLYSLSAETASNASILTTTAFTVERYLAICHPFNKHTDLSRIVKYVAGIWAVAFVLAVPLCADCLYNFSDNHREWLKYVYVEYIFSISAFLFFVVPMVVIVVLYVRIGVTLRKHKEDVPLGRNVLCNDKRIVRMLIAVVIVFFICWAPFQFQRLTVTFHVLSDSAHVILTIITSVMYYISTTINPILYSLMSERFRRAFKITLRDIYGKCRCYIKTVQRESGSVSFSMKTNSSSDNEGTNYRTISTKSTANVQAA